MSDRRSLTLSSALAAILVTLTPATQAGSLPDYEYSGVNGPGFWQDLPGFEACGRSTEPGARQSPIDLTAAEVDASLRPLRLRLASTPLRLTNDGHTVEQEYEPGSQLVVDGVVHELLQFHFHTLSDHAVDGRRGALELHAVFRDRATGRLAVVGQIYRIGEESEFLRDLLADGLPLRPGDEVIAPREVNLADALTNTRAYYTYEGSLTKPPCSETVTWFVLARRPTLSAAQARAFTDVVGNNFRPIQELNGRTLLATPSVRVRGDRRDEE